MKVCRNLIACLHIGDAQIIKFFFMETKSALHCVLGGVTALVAIILTIIVLPLNVQAEFLLVLFFLALCSLHFGILFFFRDIEGTRRKTHNFA